MNMRIHEIGWSNLLLMRLDIKVFAVWELCAIALLLTNFSSVASGADVRRDWNNYPAVLELDTNEHVFAIGDVHGDRKRLVKVLRAAKLVPALPSAPDQVKWAGGKSVLVIVGDLIDKGHQSLQVIALLRTLQSDAASHGGKVIILMGNHEAEFLARREKREFFEQLNKAGPDPTEVANCKRDLGQFLCNLPIAVRVNDWFFSHGGNTNNRTIAGLSAAIEAGINKDGFDTEELTDDNSILEARLHGKSNWVKKYEPKELLADYVTKLGVKHLVQGHQPGKVQIDGIKRKKYTFFQRYGLLFLIDSGMSRHIKGSDSTGGALRIRNGENAIVICANGARATLWDVSTNSDHQTMHCTNKSLKIKG